MMTKRFSLSANIENGVRGCAHYIVTPNVEKVVAEIVSQYQAGIHSFNIIGTYGTGKSCFLLNLEQDLLGTNPHGVLVRDSRVLARVSGFEIINVVGEYESLEQLLASKLSSKANGRSALEMLRNFYSRLKKQDKMLVIVVDEFGKVLEHAAKNEVEKELYFLQQLAEFVNIPGHNILLLTTLHQNFGAYAQRLTVAQKNEWTKVKGRFQEVVFAEPVEQLLYMVAESIRCNIAKNKAQTHALFEIAKACRFVSPMLKETTMEKLYPLDVFSAVTLTKAIQKYGQNERSLFSFLNAQGANSLSKFLPTEHRTYSMSEVYDYIVASFYSYLTSANADSMGWSAIRIAMERVESTDWDSSIDMTAAIKTVKTIGLLNIFGGAGFSMSKSQLATYMQLAMDIEQAESVIDGLMRLRVIRYAEYKHRFILFEGTDINIEEEIAKASTIVPLPTSPVDSLRAVFNSRVVAAKAYHYQSGTPRYFEYILCDSPQKLPPPIGEVDGYVELIFSTASDINEQVRSTSKACDCAIVFCIFHQTNALIVHLHKMQVYQYIIDSVLVDKSDKVALREIGNLKAYEQSLLNKELKEDMFLYDSNVAWFYKGEELQMSSQRDFNALLTTVCKDIYPLAPVINNELINRHKLSSNISAARIKYLQALISDADKEDLGWDKGKFPPEKTIYYTLLKITGLHDDGQFADTPTSEGILPLWNACEDFMRSTQDRPRKVSEYCCPVKLKRA